MAVIAALFAAIYKVLPDRDLEWRDVMVGAVFTSVLFTVGKVAIGYYIGASGAAQGFGVAGTLVVVLLWIYYSAVIFLLGAEFTRAWSGKEEARPEDARLPEEVKAVPPKADSWDAADPQAVVATAALLGGLSLLRRLWRGRRAAD